MGVAVDVHRLARALVPRVVGELDEPARRARADQVVAGRITDERESEVGLGPGSSALMLARASCRNMVDSVCQMTAPTPYIHFPGTARDAMNFYGDVFGCAVQLHTFEEFGRTDGPPDAVAHGYLVEGPVALFAADVTEEGRPLRCDGMMLALLGASVPTVLRSWFSKLSEGGTVVDDLQMRPWGATDGQVIDRYGLHWLIGFEDDEPE